MTSFDNADFVVYSAEGSPFSVSRVKLQDGSLVFRDMFSCCDASNDDSSQVLELSEKEAELAILLRLLHTPPDPPVEFIRLPRTEKVKTHLPIRYDLSTAIPLPIIRLMRALADKYAIEASILKHLEPHLVAHAPEHALEVYSTAVSLGMPLVVNEASQYILPLSWYSQDEIKLIPTAISYHNIHRLQTFRVKALQDILLREPLFPHGYGTCPNHDDAAAIWERTALILSRKIESNSDVGGEMESLYYIYQSCSACSKALRAALDMLAYKCRRVPRRLDQLPNEDV
ncbi:hypothetical protein MIND_00455100 [Mycena indigotica]|uniref:BTB domain-containing protein n=1 Tax=Mycena indigotica TaxID=2126181 RepID=A0A8H6SXJ5_9AGAR|nr:uncharacterized protein MIND_00455100 [Mycena indigotica]KAF7306637.1 hypothetical protein MIND_00455100 [Mycena indigotica]